MKSLKMLFLCVLCFYYAVLTPGSKRVDDGANYYYDALFLGLMQALVTSAIFYFLRWPSEYLSPIYLYGKDYLDILAYVGPVAGGWTFLGGIYYPILAEIIDKEQKDEYEKKSRSAYMERNRIAAEINAYKKAYFELYEKNPDACREMIRDAYHLHDQDKGHENPNVLFKNAEFVLSEVNRLNLH